MHEAILGLAGLMSLSSASFAAVLTTEDQIHQAIVGNTISGTEDRKPYTEYFLPDGNLRGVDPEGPYACEWRITGRELCERSFAQRADDAAPNEGSPTRLGMHGRRDHRLRLRGSSTASATRPAVSREIRASLWQSCSQAGLSYDSQRPIATTIVASPVSWFARNLRRREPSAIETHRPRSRSGQPQEHVAVAFT